MAKQRKMLPARKQGDRSRDDDSLLIRSAESLGRMIGSLQRQLDGASRRMSATADDVMQNLPAIPLGTGDGARKGAAKATRKTSARFSGAARTRNAGARKNGARTANGARTSARARKGASTATKKR